MIVLKIVASNSSYDYKTLLEAVGSSTDDLRLNKIAATINAICNLVIYIVMFIPLVIVGWNYLTEDFSEYKNNQKPRIIQSLLFGLLFTGVVYLVDLLVSKVGTSNNQEVIEDMFSYKSLIFPMVLSVVVFGPVVEELIFRKAIFNLFKNKHWIIPIIVSSLLFALPHMLSTNNVSAIKWLVLLVPYLISGLMLGVIYKISNENIFVTIIAHIVNNIFAVILIFI